MRNNSKNRQKIPYVKKPIQSNFIKNLDNNSTKQNESNKKIDIPNDKYDYKKWLLFAKQLNNQYNNKFLDSKYFHGHNCDENDIEFENKLNKKWRCLKNISSFEPKKYIEINDEITDINSILNIIKKYPISDDKYYNINLKCLHKIKEPLQKLNDMIGLSSIKSSIIDNILYFMQDLHKSSNGKEMIDFMNVVLYGPPGTGKTEVAMILGEIYSKLGILKKGTFKKVTRSDLIGGYLGQTALKTTAVIKDSLDGILFIDEAYSLGNEEKKDMYAKECLDTLCEAASFYKERLMIIIAGYKDELQNCFFSYNKGLESRFPWRYETDKYNAFELSQIIKKKIYEINWTLSESITEKELSLWFEQNYKYFTYFGRDIENLLSKIKIVHSKRVFGKCEQEKRVINIHDFNEGLIMYLNNDDIKKEQEKNDISNIFHIYS